MSIVAGIFFLGFTVTILIGKGILMSQAFAEAELERQNPRRQTEGNVN